MLKNNTKQFSVEIHLISILWKNSEKCTKVYIKLLGVCFVFGYGTMISQE